MLDENNAPVRDARVRIRPVGSVRAANEARTGSTGAFTIPLTPGDYLIDVLHEGYYALRDRPITVSAQSREIIFTINRVREVLQSVNVKEETSPVELAVGENKSQLSGTEINDMPYANSHSLISGLQLLPEIVQDTSGAVHVNGASENQVLYLLNGFDLTNPISGRLQTTLAVEGIRSIDVSSGRYSPEFGRGSAGVVGINTASGDDRLRYTATDFIPGLSIQQGLHLGNWYPRFGVSGPIVRGKAWFSDMVSFAYTQSVINGLPKNANTRSGWLGSNVLHTQVNLTPANILFADFLVNIDNEGRVGLGPLNPVSTTLAVDTRQYFESIKDQISFGRGALIEFGYARTDFSAKQTPEGSALYVFAPQGNSGNYFVNANQTASRDQALVHAYLPRVHFLGEHQFEAGTEGDFLRYSGDFRRTGYEVVGLSGQLISQTVYGAPAAFGVHNAEAAWWLLDTWNATKRVQFALGIRQEWNQRIGEFVASPRLSVAWSPTASGRTRLAGGYAITRDPVTLDVLGMPYDQIAQTTTYSSAGIPTGPAQPTTFTVPGSHLTMPRATNWNVAVNHQLAERIYISANYIRRRGTDELIYVNAADPNAPPSLLPIPAGTSAGAYQLTNLRRDDFDAIRFSVRQVFSGQYEWRAAYTHSRAISNALLDPSAPEPLQILSSLRPMPWNAPNRLLAFAYLPLPWKNWNIAALTNLRSGFPYSVRDQTGLVVGGVNAYHFPLNFDLNLAIERIITLRGYRFALRGGVDNLTNQLNATAVGNVVGAPNFGQYLGREGRHFVVRIRFLAYDRASASKTRVKTVAPPAPAPAPAPVPETNAPLPSASIYGNTGLWKVVTADVLARHQIAVSGWYDRVNRNPGHLVISTAGVGAAYGIFSRLEFGFSFEANREVTTGRQDQLSFGQQALGFFGNKTPGSPPLASELMPGSSKVPQLRSPATASGALTGAAGYYDLFPFAGFVSSGSAVGDAIFGLKIALLSESKGAPVSVAVRPYFDLPIHKAISFQLTHPVGTADLQGGADGIVSKHIGDIAEVIVNAGYRYISQPVHVSVFQLAKDVPLGFGVVVPRSARIQFVAESTADIFVGAHTPNTTFGAEDPVDLTLGVRGDFARRLTFSGGYRRPLNQFGGDKNGFVVSVGFVRGK